MSSRKSTPAGKQPSPEPFDAAALYRALREHYGPSGWWPGDSPLEIAVGAVLTQNTAWVNVEKAIAALKSHSMLDIRRMHDSEPSELARLIRPSGYYNLKASRLKNLVRAVMEQASGDMEAFLDRDLSELRAALLAVDGIGKETADSICCYAAGRLVFVVDAYTRRILSRHGVIDAGADYEIIRQLFEHGLPRELSVYRDLHAYLVFVGKDFRRKSSPRCADCPLEAWRHETGLP